MLSPRSAWFTYEKQIADTFLSKQSQLQAHFYSKTKGTEHTTVKWYIGILHVGHVGCQNNETAIPWE